MTGIIVQVYCPACRCDVLAEVRPAGTARRCACPWCDHQLRVPQEKAA